MVYAKEVKTTDPRFRGREALIMSQSPTYGNVEGARIPVPDTVVLCDGCNRNLYPNPGYLVYLDKRAMEKDRPYDIYCEDCLKEYFPAAVKVAPCMK